MPFTCRLGGKGHRQISRAQEQSSPPRAGSTDTRSDAWIQAGNAAVPFPVVTEATPTITASSWKACVCESSSASCGCFLGERLSRSLSGAIVCACAFNHAAPSPPLPPSLSPIVCSCSSSLRSAAKPFSHSRFTVSTGASGCLLPQNSHPSNSRILQPRPNHHRVFVQSFFLIRFSAYSQKYCLWVT